MSASVPAGVPAPASDPHRRPVPATVDAAFWLVLVSVALGLVAGGVGIAGLFLPGYLDGLQATYGLDGDQIVAITVGGVVGGSVGALVGSAIFVLTAVALRRGARWARIVMTVLAGLSVTGAVVPFATGGATAITALQVAVLVAVVVLLWLAPSNAYFAGARGSTTP